MLPDGRRLHLNDGPIDLIIGAEGDDLVVLVGVDGHGLGT